MSPADQEMKSTTPGLDVWNVQKILTWSTTYLKEKCVDHDVRSHRLEAELLLAFALGCDRIRLYMDLEKPLAREERESFKTLLRRRIEGEPVSYVLGYKDFFKYRFVVNPAVLVPRADTELLVEHAIMDVRLRTTPRVLDIGTGSGCIAISVALECPEAQIVAWDISEEALRVAEVNNETLGASVEFAQCDARKVLASYSGPKFDVILSNPPYVSRSELPSLSPSVKNYEPALALFGDDDGLAFYALYANSLKQCLNPNGTVHMEIGATQSASVAELFQNAGWRKISIDKDLSGNDRLLRATRPD